MLLVGPAPVAASTVRVTPSVVCAWAMPTPASIAPSSVLRAGAARVAPAPIHSIVSVRQRVITVDPRLAFKELWVDRASSCRVSQRARQGPLFRGVQDTLEEVRILILDQMDRVSIPQFLQLFSSSSLTAIKKEEEWRQDLERSDLLSIY
jgi:hypothetical protein